MSDPNVIPETYDQWRDCITIRCGIPLTNRYAQSRLAELRNADDPKTIEFASKYGSAYLNQVIHWFDKAAQE